MRRHVLQVCCLLLLATCESRRLYSGAVEGGQQLPVRAVTGIYGDWGSKASHNLSMWRSNLFQATEKWIQSKYNNDKPMGNHERFELFMPFLDCPPSRPLRRVGPAGDGGKWLCDPSGLEAPCNILSLGSNMDFSFEEAMLRETNCTIATFDCTCAGKVLGPRHTFHKNCVGSAAASQRDSSILTYASIAYATNLKAPPLLKIDVEMYEFPFLGELTEHSNHLPEQISVEIHLSDLAPTLPADQHPQWGRKDLGVLDASLFFFHLANLGYGVVSYEKNDWDGRCAEFTLFRVEAPFHRGGW